MENSENLKIDNPSQYGSEKHRSASFKRTDDRAVIIKLINDRLLNKQLTVQLPTVETKYAQVKSADEKELQVQFFNYIPPKGLIHLSGFLNNYFTEIGVKVQRPFNGDIYICQPAYLRIASKKRMDQRFEINDFDEIYVNKIRISELELNVRAKSIPVAYKILFQQFQSENSGIADRVIISAFNDSDDIYDYVYKTRKTVFVPDIRKGDSFAANDRLGDFVDLKEYFKKSFEREQASLVKKDSIGWIVSPILGPSVGDKWVPLGYIELSSKTAFDVEKLMEVKELSLRIVEKLRDMNVLERDIRQRILDVSRGGLRLEITDPRLIKNIMQRSTMTFDIILRMQAPITVQGIIRSTKETDDASLLVGLKIQGENSRENQMGRYLHFIRELAHLHDLKEKQRAEKPKP